MLVRAVLGVARAPDEARRGQCERCSERTDTAKGRHGGYLQQKVCLEARRRGGQCVLHGFAGSMFVSLGTTDLLPCFATEAQVPLVLLSDTEAAM